MKLFKEVCLSNLPMSTRKTKIYSITNNKRFFLNPVGSVDFSEMESSPSVNQEYTDSLYFKIHKSLQSVIAILSNKHTNSQTFIFFLIYRLVIDVNRRVSVNTRSRSYPLY